MRPNTTSAEQVKLKTTKAEQNLQETTKAELVKLKTETEKRKRVHHGRGDRAEGHLSR